MLLQWNETGDNPIFKKFLNSDMCWPLLKIFKKLISLKIPVQGIIAILPIILFAVWNGIKPLTSRASSKHSIVYLVHQGRKYPKPSTVEPPKHWGFQGISVISIMLQLQWFTPTPVITIHSGWSLPLRLSLSLLQTLLQSSVANTWH